MGGSPDPNDGNSKLLLQKVKFAVSNPVATAKIVKRKLQPSITRSAVRVVQTVAGDANSLAAFAQERLDREGYLRRYPDVRAAGVDPIQHWLEHGVFEGRWFAPRLNAVVGETAKQLVDRAWRAFEWRGHRVLIYSTRVDDLADASDREFIAYVEEHFDAAAYLERYPDVKASGGDPFEHWLQYGLYEGRFFTPGMVARLDAKSSQTAGKHWRKFKWLGRDVSVRTRQFRRCFMKQIEEQARHDASVLAPGHLAIPFLPEFDGHDLLSRDGVEVRSVFRAIEARPDLIVLTPFMCAGGAEKYAADLVRAFSDSGRGSTLVIVTDQSGEEAKGWHDLDILNPFTRVQVIFWRDICGPNYLPHVSMARFINAIRPKHVLVNNSRAGLDAVATFGRGLSQSASIFCTYFSNGVFGLGAPHGVRFPQRTLPFATALTDNQPMADTLARQWGGISTHAVATLPPRVEIAGTKLFAERINARINRTNRPGQNHWVWVSRVEPFKGTAILAEIAKLNCNDEFHIFGPMQNDLESLGLDLPNVRYEGVLASVLESEFSSYDGFLFTSLFEGMPNVVLEMSQHGIPLILANVGGLRSTFGAKSALFVDHAENALDTARRFSDAMKNVTGLSREGIIAMAKSAYEDVQGKHGNDAYLQNVGQLLGQEAARA